VKLIVSQMRLQYSLISSKDPTLRQMNLSRTSFPVSFRSILILSSHELVYFPTVSFFQVSGKFGIGISHILHVFYIPISFSFDLKITVFCVEQILVLFSFSLYSCLMLCVFL
jgi:hypothetical protein